MKMICIVGDIVDKIKVLRQKLEDIEINSREMEQLV
jgi:hypothetical protein